MKKFITLLTLIFSVALKSEFNFQVFVLETNMTFLCSSEKLRLSDLKRSIKDKLKLALVDDIDIYFLHEKNEKFYLLDDDSKLMKTYYIWQKRNSFKHIYLQIKKFEQEEKKEVLQEKNRKKQNKSCVIL